MYVKPLSQPEAFTHPASDAAKAKAKAKPPATASDAAKAKLIADPRALLPDSVSFTDMPKVLA